MHIKCVLNLFLPYILDNNGKNYLMILFTMKVIMMSNK